MHNNINASDDIYEPEPEVLMVTLDESEMELEPSTKGTTGTTTTGTGTDVSLFSLARMMCFYLFNFFFQTIVSSF